MKKIHYFIIAGLASLSMVSCHNLTLEPKDQMGLSNLLNRPEDIRVYLAAAYQALPIEDFNYTINNGYGKRGNGNAWDRPNHYQGGVCGEWVLSGHGGVDEVDGFDYWPYDDIRYVNTMLDYMPSVRGNFSTEEAYNDVIAEARFLRAWYYFSLAKRYGGVPIVTTVMDATAPMEELLVSRSTEDEIWQFIHDELEFAMNNLLDNRDTNEKGRANKYAAGALMSRAMLYAGTIAKYGEYIAGSSEWPAVQLGYVGIPASRADYYFQETLKATAFVKAGPYQLVGEDLPQEQKEQNYVDLFLSLNDEDIFTKQYSSQSPGGAELYHSYDGAASPPAENGAVDGMAQWPGSMFVPTIESVELFQKLPLENPDGTPRRFDRREDLFANRADFEPRMMANFFFNGDMLRGKPFKWQRGVYYKYDGTQRDALLGERAAPSGLNLETNRFIGNGKAWTYDPRNANQTPYLNEWLAAVKEDHDGNGTIGQEDLMISDYHGNWGGGEDQTMTGVYTRKYVDYNLGIQAAGANSSWHPWKAFRFAEILLNEAEAAYELGQKEIAYENIRRIRTRAGAVAWTPSGAPATTYLINGQIVDENLEYIREERARELLFENHRWFDIRRWRVADKARMDGGDNINVLTGTPGFSFGLNRFRPLAVYPYFVISEGKYIFIREYTAGWKEFTFPARAYYEDLPGGERDKNPNIINNPLW